MNKLTKLTNPIVNIERALDGFFNLTPIFHDLEEVYRTGDTVRFNANGPGLKVQIDLPGVEKEDLDISVDEKSRDVYISAKREIISHGSTQSQVLNRGFTVGTGLDITKIKFDYNNGMLTATVPQCDNKSNIKKIKL